MRRWIVGFALTVIATETLTVGLAIRAQVARGIPADVLLEHYLLTRGAVSWWWPNETAARLVHATAARYLGFAREAGVALFVRDAALGVRMRPGALTLHRINSPAGYYWVATDRFGFVLNQAAALAPATHKPADEFRVIMLGGSTVVGIGAPSFESIPAHLERRMSGPSGKRVRVINAGVGAYSSAQELLYLATELLDWDPDLVIVYDGWNDQVASAYPPVSREGGPGLSGRVPVHEALSAYLDDSTRMSGALASLMLAIGLNGSYVWYRTGLQEAFGWAGDAAAGLRERAKRVIEARPALRAAVAPRGTRDDTIPYHPEVAEAYRSNLHSMAALARARGRPVAIFLQPLMGVDDKTYAGSERETERAMSSAFVRWRRSFYADARRNLSALREAWATDGGVCVADLSRVLADHGEALYVDTGHLTGPGNAVVAAGILRRLDGCAVVPR